MMNQINIEELRRKVEIKELLERKGELTEDEAAYFLDLEPKRLRHWRSNGRGPVFRKMEGEVRYLVQDLNQFKTNGIRNPSNAAAGFVVAASSAARRGRRPKRAV
jgi:hypothetical protein